MLDFNIKLETPIEDSALPIPILNFDPRPNLLKSGSIIVITPVYFYS